MSQSDYLKTDIEKEQDVMWKKLSTVHDPDMQRFRQAFERGLRGGVKQGELAVFASGGKGNSMYIDIETNG